MNAAVRRSVVPVEEQDVTWPTDLLLPQEYGEREVPVKARPYDGIEPPESRNRWAGCSAERQRYFLENLAETGSVHLASTAARLSARSAYRLRTRSPAFARAWGTALQLSVGRLSARLRPYCIHGTLRKDALRRRPAR